jgi:uncharacterized repeat protein (TIGR03803 family)
MKKLLFFLAVVICNTANAQYTKIFDFNSAIGEQPHGSLIMEGDYLYGMTYYGGTGGGGVLFKIKPDGSGFDSLVNFNGTNGWAPNSALFSDGTYLYGTTNQGGAGSRGVIFKIKPDGTGFSKLMDFTGTATGGQPLGDFISDGTYLYGTTNQGGANDKGVVYKIKPDGSGYTILHHFGSVSYDGSYPCGGLISYNTSLYGMTNQGGLNGYGIVYKINPDGTGYTKLMDVSGNLIVMYPEGSLISVGTYLYGVMHYGGPGTGGAVFKILPDGTGYDTLVCFTGTNGCRPMSSLICDGTFFYGVTSDGGIGTCNNGKGVIFKLKPDGTEFAKLFNFTGATSGNTPMGSLYSDGNFLYGMTYGGGANDKGVIFKYYPISVNASMVGIPICSGQCNGSAGADIMNGHPPYNYSWNTVPVQTTAIATGLCAGTTYRVTVVDSLGSASDSITIATLPSPIPPSICAVTVDSLSQYNVVLWDKTQYLAGSVEYFTVYREISTNNYQPIGIVPFDSLSMFIDTVRSQYFPNTGNPNNGTYRYKLMVHDNCGINSDIGLFHNTIYTTNNNGTFSWNLYTIEGSNNPVNSYVLLRDDNNTGDWHTVAGVSGTQQTVTDPQYSTYQNTAAWRVQTQWSINCIPTANKNLNYNSSLSNIYTLNGSGIQNNENGLQVIISPNPVSDNLMIEVPAKATVDILNIQGQLIKSLDANSLKMDIDVSAFSKGVYFIEIKTDKGIAIKKFVKQ